MLHLRQKRGSLLLIVLVAFFLRLIVVAFLLPDTYNPRRGFWPFGYEAGRIAQSIASGEGFANPLFEKTGPTAWMAPVYPYLLAGIFKLFGIYSKASAVAALSLNSLLSALTCLPIFCLARKSFSELTAIRAAWAWALFPYALYLSADSVWETCLSALLLTTLFLLVSHLQESANLWPWAGFGLLWGLTGLTSPVLLSVLPVMVGWACYRLRGNSRAWIVPLGVCALTFAVVLAPWMVRNYRTFHRFIPLRDNFWLEVWVGNNGDTSHWFNDAAHPSFNDRELEEFDRLGELAYMERKRMQAMSFIQNHPGTFPVTSLRRFIFTWTGFWSLEALKTTNPHRLADEPFDGLNLFISIPLTILTLTGLRRAFAQARGAAFPFALILLLFPLTYYVTHPMRNYRHPIDPEIVILAVYGLPAHSWKRLRSSAGVLESAVEETTPVVRAPGASAP